ncbi:MAG: sensor N-terminal transmembrane domain-containing protein, partial [Micropepsaceae bacterium]
MAEGPIAEPPPPGRFAPDEAPVLRAEARSEKARPPKPARRVRLRWFSPLTRRILLVNTVPLFLLVVGVLYLDTYRSSLIDQELAALTTQGRIIAAALGEAAVAVVDSPDPA